MKPTVAVPALAVALLAPTAAAQGAALTLDRPCYLSGQHMGINGTGWGPGSQWALQGEGIDGSGTADASGNFGTTDEVAPEASGIKPRKSRLSGLQDGTELATATIRSVNLVGRPANDNGKPTGSVKWLFSGLFLGKSIFVHVKRGKHVYTTRAGRAKGPCGTLKKRLKRLPGVPSSQIRDGRYKVRIDNRRKYRPGGLQTGGVITVSTS